MADEKPWWEDNNHPLYDPFWAALRRPWAYMVQGWPQEGSPIWPGRGLAGEVGARAYGALRAEKPGWWPTVLDAFERMVDAREAEEVTTCAAVPGSDQQQGTT
jgi:hypothetical protein